MNYKLKHLSKYCCKPSNETEFEAVKMSAELGGVGIWQHKLMTKLDKEYPHSYIAPDGHLAIVCNKGELEEIPILDFIKKLRMTEEDAKEIEDDRVEFCIGENWAYIDGCKGIEAVDGHYFRVSQDGLTVTLHKKEVK